MESRPDSFTSQLYFQKPEWVFNVSGRFFLFFFKDCVMQKKNAEKEDWANASLFGLLVSMSVLPGSRWREEVR